MILNTKKAMKAYPVKYDILCKRLKELLGLEETDIEIVSALAKLREYTTTSMSRKHSRYWVVFVMRYQYRLTYREIGAVLGFTLERGRQQTARELKDFNEILNDEYEEVSL